MFRCSVFLRNASNASFELLFEIHSFKFSSKYISLCFNLSAVLKAVHQLFSAVQMCYQSNSKLIFIVQSIFSNFFFFQSIFHFFLVTALVMFSNVFILNCSLPLHFFHRRAPKFMLECETVQCATTARWASGYKELRFPISVWIVVTF